MKSYIHLNQRVLTLTHPDFGALRVKVNSASAKDARLELLNEAGRAYASTLLSGMLKIGWTITSISAVTEET